METEVTLMGTICVVVAIAILALIGGCTYNERQAANEKFQLEMQRLEMTAAGNPTKLEVIVHKMDDEQFKQLIEAIKESK